MPELPEVERGRRLAEATALGRTIVGVEVAADRIVCCDQDPREIEAVLLGSAVRAACRHGKQLWLEFDRPPHLLIHFGMTGALQTRTSTHLALESGPKVKDPSWPPRFAKLSLKLDDGGELVFTDPRRLGRIRLRTSPRTEPPISELGFDPLLGMPGRTEFAARLQARKVSIKSLLLDQSVAAGIGNWLADEILYQAGVDPRLRADRLSGDQVEAIRLAMDGIVATATLVDAEKDRFPKDWLFHVRWGRNADARTERGEAVQHLTIGGRTTAWVPARQESRSKPIGRSRPKKQDSPQKRQTR